MGEVFDSWALSQAGDANLAVARIKASLAAYRATGGELWQPYFLALVADCLRAVGQMKDAGHCIVEALTRAAATGERWFEAELLRLRGEVRLVSGIAEDEAVEVCFQNAIEIAREQGARWWELRAATSLARLWAEQGRRREAYDLLAPIYDWFTEGLDLPALREARAVLQEVF
jgi:predicted ATPase